VKWQSSGIATKLSAVCHQHYDGPIVLDYLKDGKVCSLGKVTGGSNLSSEKPRGLLAQCIAGGAQTLSKDQLDASSHRQHLDTFSSSALPRQQKFRKAQNPKFWAHPTQFGTVDQCQIVSRSHQAFDQTTNKMWSYNVSNMGTLHAESGMW